MAAFDRSPRGAKRRKTTAEESTPIYSHVLRTVKQAFHRKPPSPGNSDEPYDPVEKTSSQSAEKIIEGKRSSKDRGGVRTTENPGIWKDSTIKGLENRKKETQITSFKRDEEGPSRQKFDSGNSSKGGVEDTESPSKKRRRKYKGWAYVEDGEEPTLGVAPGETSGMDDKVGRVKRGREDLTIDINPHQLKPRNSLDKVNLMGINEDSVNEPTNGRTRRTSRRIEAKEEGSNGTFIAEFSRKKNQANKSHRDTAMLFDAEDALHTNLGNISREEASPDELVQETQGEESGQDRLLQTPTSKSKKRYRRSTDMQVNHEPARVLKNIGPATQETVLQCQSPFTDQAQALQEMLSEDPAALKGLQAHILSGLTGRRRLPLINFEDEEVKVSNLIEQTILAGEGNSMLVIGSRGSGKSSLVETILSKLSSDHRDDFHVVRLNGFIHTDDKLALREIWRQLGREMNVEDDELGSRSNYADTLTSLLALLAHPASEDDGTATARSVVFILDEFDLFASHPRQTLLYNLFDVAQSRNAPIAVLGLTTKVNVVDSLEKRVKSRFGQRYVHLSLPKTFSAFQDICLSALSYHPSTHDLLHHHATDLKRLSTAWNDYISALFSTQSFQHFLQTLYVSTKSIPAFLNASLLPVSTMTPTTLPTTASFISHTLQPPDSKLALIPSLSTLALSLLIAAARLDIILDTDVCTFGMAYEEYVSLASRSKLQSSAAGQMAIGGGARVWSKELAQGAWEYLGKLELVLPAVGGRGAGKGEMWRVDVGLEEIGAVLDGESGRGGPLGRWCREI